MYTLYYIWQVFGTYYSQTLFKFCIHNVLTNTSAFIIFRSLNYQRGYSELLFTVFIFLSLINKRDSCKYKSINVFV